MYKKITKKQANGKHRYEKKKIIKKYIIFICERTVQHSKQIGNLQ